MELKIGSNVFFYKFPDYIFKDTDILLIEDTNLPPLHWTNDKDDIFLYPDWSKEQFIEDCKILPMKVGKFLVKDFADYIGLTISDLKKLDYVFQNLDEKHTYERLIYEFYLENNDFHLTEKQLKIVFEEYKRTRPDRYKNPDS